MGQRGDGGRRWSRIAAPLGAATVCIALAVGCAGIEGADPDDTAEAGSTTSAVEPASTTTVSTSTTTRPTTTTTTAPIGRPGRRAVVASITDGDTFRTEDGERVRLIGIDTPEVDGEACFATEATAALTRLAPPGTEVVLEIDVEETDRFGRTLAYVHRVADDLLVNLELARLGVAVQLTVPPNVARAEEIGRVVAEARDAGRGLWGGCTTTTSPAPPPAPPPVLPAVPTVPPATSPPSGACHPSYPTVCIPPAPPDLDCPQIPHRRFTVVGEDPHGFDGDHDGVGCESG